MASDTRGLTPGRTFSCDACGNQSVAKLKPRMDGWTRVGDDLVCGLCGAVTIEDYSPESSKTAAPSFENRDALSQALGVEFEERQDLGEVLGEDGKTRFCRDCKHYIKHPFLSRCGYWDRPVEPMNDCPRFEAAAKDDDGDDE